MASNLIGSYPINGAKVLIINVEHYQRPKDRRLGSQEDVRRLRDLFRSFDFNVRIEAANGTRQEILSALKEFSRSDNHNNMSMTVVCLMAHGGMTHAGNGYLVASDNKKIDLEKEVYSLFTADTCDALANKPKLFIIQACRGKKEQNGIRVLATDADAPDGSQETRTPECSHCVIMSSTIPHYVSYRCEIEGAVFIQALCKVFEKFASRLHLADLLTIVSKDINELGLQTPEYSYRGFDKHLQFPIISSKLARDMKEMSEAFASIGNLELYKLPVKLEHVNENYLFRHISVGDDLGLDKPVITILLVGPQGAGKSLLVDAIANYVFGVNFADNFRFKLTENDFEWITCYRLNYQKGFRVNCTIRLIDTPGFGDSRGVECDESIIQSLKALFSDKTLPINEVSSVAWVTQASQVRFHDQEKWSYMSVLDMFGKENVLENVSNMSTFSNDLTENLPSVLRAFPFHIANTFEFNNAALFASNDNTYFYEYIWDFGFKSLEQFFFLSEKISPASLDFTKCVMDEAKIPQDLRLNLF